MCVGVGMNAVALHQIFVRCDTVHEKLYPRNIEFTRELAIDILERLCIAGTIVRGYADAEKDNRGAAGFAAFDDKPEIVSHALRGNPAQAVVAAQFENDD